MVFLYFLVSLRAQHRIYLYYSFIYLFISRSVHIEYIQVLEKKDIASPKRFNHLTQPHKPKKNKTYIRLDKSILIRTRVSYLHSLHFGQIILYERILSPPKHNADARRKLKPSASSHQTPLSFALRYHPVPFSTRTPAAQVKASLRLVFIDNVFRIKVGIVYNQ